MGELSQTDLSLTDSLFKRKQVIILTLPRTVLSVLNTMAIERLVRLLMCMHYLVSVH